MFGLTCSRPVELLSVAVEQLIFSYNHRGFKLLDYIKIYIHFTPNGPVIFEIKSLLWSLMAPNHITDQYNKIPDDKGWHKTVLLVHLMHLYASFHIIFDHSNHLTIQVCIHPLAHVDPLVAGLTARVPRCSGELTVTHQRAIWGPAFGSKSVELATTPQCGLQTGFMHWSLMLAPLS